MLILHGIPAAVAMVGRTFGEESMAPAGASRASRSYSRVEKKIQMQSVFGEEQTMSFGLRKSAWKNGRKISIRYGDVRVFLKD